MTMSRQRLLLHKCYFPGKPGRARKNSLCRKRLYSILTLFQVYKYNVQSSLLEPFLGVSNVFWESESHNIYGDSFFHTTARSEK